MDMNKQKELFNIAYVCALAAQAGIKHSFDNVDDDSIDISLKAKGYTTSNFRNAQIEVQLKCTSNEIRSGNVLKFSLPRKNYDDLRGHNVILPRYLFVLVVPNDHNEWIIHNEENMILSHACYWVSVKDHPYTTNSSNITIDIPLSQKLTASSLRELMFLASERKSA